MEKLLTVKEYERMQEEYNKVKYMCKCGHKNIIPYNEEKVVCTFCGNYVFKNKKDEDIYRIREKMRK